MKMYLLSDNVDTLRGMRLAGVDAEEALGAASRRFSEKLKQEHQ